ncbi:hypothetical protein ISS07_01355 [Candidatus Woesearchaeota archaeon]|nr:hypothetical protein [Candidatus Woesearchaeota archaeon]
MAGKKREFADIFLIFLFVLLFFLTSSFDLSFLIWLVNIPLLVAVYGKSLKKTLLLSGVGSLIAVSLSFRWVMNYSFEVYLFSVITFFSFLVLFFIIFNVLTKKIRGSLQVFVAPFVYSVLMIIYQFGPMDNYWANWAMFNPMAAPLIWFVGSLGITFIIILFHSVLAFYLIKKDKKMLFFVIFIAIVMFGSFVYSFHADAKGKDIGVALIQGNYMQSWDWRNENAKGSILDSYLNLTTQASAKKPKMVVWPEYAIADDFLDDKNTINKISSIANKTESYIVVGTVRFVGPEIEPFRKRNNIALVFSPSGEIFGEYNSVSPLPFDKEVVKGSDIETFESDIGVFGIFLCYEETQKEIAKEEASMGAEFLIVMANEAILDHSSGFELISRYSNLRAAENGRYLLRATNTGITKIVSPYGKTTEKIEPYKPGILYGKIMLNKNKTFYSKFGDLILYLVLIILGTLIFWKLFSGKRK